MWKPIPNFQCRWIWLIKYGKSHKSALNYYQKTRYKKETIPSHAVVSPAHLDYNSELLSGRGMIIKATILSLAGVAAVYALSHRHRTVWHFLSKWLGALRAQSNHTATITCQRRSLQRGRNTPEAATPSLQTWNKDINRGKLCKGMRPKHPERYAVCMPGGESRVSLHSCKLHMLWWQPEQLWELRSYTVVSGAEPVSRGKSLHSLCEKCETTTSFTYQQTFKSFFISTHLTLLKTPQHIKAQAGQGGRTQAQKCTRGYWESKQ